MASEIEATREAVARLVAPPRVDILVQRGKQVIEEIGIAGSCFATSPIMLHVDPDNPMFERSLADGALQRQVAHEAHHSLRWAGPGYGATLGEALVSEGLAGQFVSRLFGSPPEPWERAVDPAVMERFYPETEALASRSYDHAAWFFGTGGYPNQLGYTMGYRLAGAWLRSRPDVDGHTFVNVPAAEVLLAWPRRGAA